MISEERERRLKKLEALSNIRNALQDGQAWEHLDVIELIEYFDDVITREIRKL